MTNVQNIQSIEVHLDSLSAKYILDNVVETKYQGTAFKSLYLSTAQLSFIIYFILLKLINILGNKISKFPATNYRWKLSLIIFEVK